MEVARQSVKNDKMMSAYMSEFVSFNVLDADYLKEKEKMKKVSINDISIIINKDEEDDKQFDDCNTNEEILP